MTILPRRQRTAAGIGLSLATLLVAALPPGSTARASTQPRHHGPDTLATFVDADEHPESVAVGHDGTVHVALHAAARLWHRQPTGTTIVTTLPRSARPDAVTRANGIAVAPNGVVAVAVLSTDPALAGVWEGRPGATFRRVAVLPVTASPNGLSRDDDGNLYLADDALGLIWRVPARRSPGAGNAEVWLRHPLLDRAPGGTPYGANGTEVHHGRLWISNPSQTLLAAIPINGNGRPGQPEVRQRGPLFADVDDFNIARDGTLVVARIGAQTIERVRPDGATTVLATAADGLSQPTAVAIDARRRTLYITNAAFYRAPGAAPASVQSLTPWSRPPAW